MRSLKTFVTLLYDRTTLKFLMISDIFMEQCLLRGNTSAFYLIRVSEYIIIFYGKPNIKADYIFFLCCYTACSIHAISPFLYSVNSTSSFSSSSKAYCISIRFSPKRTIFLIKACTISEKRSFVKKATYISFDNKLKIISCRFKYCH